MPPGIPGLQALARLAARVRSLWRGLRHRADVEAEMAEEFRHHLELRMEDLMRQGLPPREAARQARREFGHVESHLADARASRGLRLFDRLGLSWLDVKLGVRMLLKYPGLSLVSVVGMAVAIAIGAGFFGFFQAISDPSLPLDEDERVVSLQNTNATNPGNPDRQSLHDFFLWRDELGSVRDLSAFVSDRRNLIIPGGATELVRIARMSASGFRVARVAPMLGRPLQEEDERSGAPPVVVIGHEEWRRLFDGGAPGSAGSGIIGRTVRLGTTVHTVVGVMPEGFRFPINHQYWVPLRLDPTAYERGGGPAILMFGRLADGVTMERAQAELATIGRRMAAAHPDTHGHLRPRILPYTHPFFDIDSPFMAWVLRGVQVAISLLLVVVAVNVAVLVYARTATRTGEIAVRSALGASRRRIVTQLFAEALVLSAVAAAVGLTVAGVALEAVQGFLERTTGGELPFWLDLGLSGGLMAYVGGLAVLAGVIVGVLPALKATGRRVQAGLQQLPSRGSGMRLGRTWTALIVVQVAIAVAVMPFAIYASGQSVRRGTAAPGYPAEEFLQATLSIEREEAPPSDEAEAYDQAVRTHFVGSTGELLRRLEEEPAVAGVAIASRFPGGEGFGRIEVEGAGVRSVRVNRVDVDLFDVFGVPILAGRGFTDADSTEGARAVVVDRVFAETVLGGGDVLGRRVRHLTRAASGELEEGPWLEIVGVAAALGVQPDFEPADPKLYQPIAPDYGDWVALALRTRSGTPPAAFSGRLREIAAAVDPALQLNELRSATEAERERQQSLLFLALGIVAVTCSVLLLSAAGIYAMMSFTVARRRREIGIRAALGAAPRRLLAGIFARAGTQLGAGVLAGLVVAIALDRAMGGGPLAGGGVVLIPIVAALMLGIGLLAAVGPARRGLAVEPTEALKAE